MTDAVTIAGVANKDYLSRFMISSEASNTNSDGRERTSQASKQALQPVTAYNNFGNYIGNESEEGKNDVIARQIQSYPIAVIHDVGSKNQSEIANTFISVLNEHHQLQVKSHEYGGEERICRRRKQLFYLDA